MKVRIDCQRYPCAPEVRNKSELDRFLFFDDDRNAFRFTDECNDILNVDVIAWCQCREYESACVQFWFEALEQLGEIGDGHLRRL